MQYALLLALFCCIKFSAGSLSGGLDYADDNELEEKELQDGTTVSSCRDRPARHSHFWRYLMRHRVRYHKRRVARTGKANNRKRGEQLDYGNSKYREQEDKNKKTSKNGGKKGLLSRVHLKFLKDSKTLNRSSRDESKVKAKEEAVKTINSKAKHEESRLAKQRSKPNVKIESEIISKSSNPKNANNEKKGFNFGLKKSAAFKSKSTTKVNDSKPLKYKNVKKSKNCLGQTTKNFKSSLISDLLTHNTKKLPRKDLWVHSESFHGKLRDDTSDFFESSKHSKITDLREESTTEEEEEYLEAEWVSDMAQTDKAELKPEVPEYVLEYETNPDLSSIRSSTVWGRRKTKLDASKKTTPQSRVKNKYEGNSKKTTARRRHKGKTRSTSQVTPSCTVSAFTGSYVSSPDMVLDTSSGRTTKKFHQKSKNELEVLHETTAKNHQATTQSCTTVQNTLKTVPDAFLNLLTTLRRDVKTETSPSSTTQCDDLNFKLEELFYKAASFPTFPGLDTPTEATTVGTDTSWRHVFIESNNASVQETISCRSTPNTTKMYHTHGTRPLRNRVDNTEIITIMSTCSQDSSTRSSIKHTKNLRDYLSTLHPGSMPANSTTIGPETFSYRHAVTDWRDLISSHEKTLSGTTEACLETAKARGCKIPTIEPKFLTTEIIASTTERSTSTAKPLLTSSSTATTTCLNYSEKTCMSFRHAVTDWRDMFTQNVSRRNPTSTRTVQTSPITTETTGQETVTTPTCSTITTDICANVDSTTTRLPSTTKKRNCTKLSRVTPKRRTNWILKSNPKPLGFKSQLSTFRPRVAIFTIHDLESFNRGIHHPKDGPIVAFRKLTSTPSASKSTEFKDKSIKDNNIQRNLKTMINKSNGRTTREDNDIYMTVRSSHRDVIAGLRSTTYRGIFKVNTFDKVDDEIQTTAKMKRFSTDMKYFRSKESASNEDNNRNLPKHSHSIPREKISTEQAFTKHPTSSRLKSSMSSRRVLSTQHKPLASKDYSHSRRASALNQYVTEASGGESLNTNTGNFIPITGKLLISTSKNRLNPITGRKSKNNALTTQGGHKPPEVTAGSRLGSTPVEETFILKTTPQSHLKTIMNMIYGTLGAANGRSLNSHHKNKVPSFTTSSNKQIELEDYGDTLDLKRNASSEVTTELFGDIDYFVEKNFDSHIHISNNHSPSAIKVSSRKNITEKADSAYYTEDSDSDNPDSEENYAYDDDILVEYDNESSNKYISKSKASSHSFFHSTCMTTKKSDIVANINSSKLEKVMDKNLNNVSSNITKEKIILSSKVEGVVNNLSNTSSNFTGGKIMSVSKDFKSDQDLRKVPLNITGSGKVNPSKLKEEKVVNPVAATTKDRQTATTSKSKSKNLDSDMYDYVEDSYKDVTDSYDEALTEETTTSFVSTVLKRMTPSSRYSTVTKLNSVAISKRRPSDLEDDKVTSSITHFPKLSVTFSDKDEDTSEIGAPFSMHYKTSSIKFPKSEVLEFTPPARTSRTKFPPPSVIPTSGYQKHYTNIANNTRSATTISKSPSSSTILQYFNLTMAEFSTSIPVRLSDVDRTSTKRSQLNYSEISQFSQSGLHSAESLFNSMQGTSSQWNRYGVSSTQSETKLVSTQSETKLGSTQSETKLASTESILDNIECTSAAGGLTKKNTATTPIHSTAVETGLSSEVSTLQKMPTVSRYHTVPDRMRNRTQQSNSFLKATETNIKLQGSTEIPNHRTPLASKLQSIPGVDHERLKLSTISSNPDGATLNFGVKHSLKYPKIHQNITLPDNARTFPNSSGVNVDEIEENEILKSSPKFRLTSTDSMNGSSNSFEEIGLTSAAYENSNVYINSVSPIQNSEKIPQKSHSLSLEDTDVTTATRNTTIDEMHEKILTSDSLDFEGINLTSVALDNYEVFGETVSGLNNLEKGSLGNKTEDKVINPTTNSFKTKKKVGANKHSKISNILITTESLKNGSRNFFTDFHLDDDEYSSTVYNKKDSSTEKHNNDYEQDFFQKNVKAEKLKSTTQPLKENISFQDDIGHLDFDDFQPKSSTSTMHHHSESSESSERHNDLFDKAHDTFKQINDVLSLKMKDLPDEAKSSNTQSDKATPSPMYDASASVANRHSKTFRRQHTSSYKKSKIKHHSYQSFRTTEVLNIKKLSRTSDSFEEINPYSLRNEASASYSTKTLYLDDIESTSPLNHFTKSPLQKNYNFDRKHGAQQTRKLFTFENEVPSVEDKISKTSASYRNMKSSNLKYDGVKLHTKSFHYDEPEITLKSQMKTSGINKGMSHKTPHVEHSTIHLNVDEVDGLKPTEKIESKISPSRRKYPFSEKHHEDLFSNKASVSGKSTRSSYMNFDLQKIKINNIVLSTDGNRFSKSSSYKHSTSPYGALHSSNPLFVLTEEEEEDKVPLSSSKFRTSTRAQYKSHTRNSLSIADSELTFAVHRPISTPSYPTVSTVRQRFLRSTGSYEEDTESPVTGRNFTMRKHTSERDEISEPSASTYNDADSIVQPWSPTENELNMDEGTTEKSYYLDDEYVDYKEETFTPRSITTCTPSYSKKSRKKNEHNTTHKVLSKQHINGLPRNPISQMYSKLKNRLRQIRQTSPVRKEFHPKVKYSNYEDNESEKDDEEEESVNVNENIWKLTTCSPIGFTADGFPKSIGKTLENDFNERKAIIKNIKMVLTKETDITNDTIDEVINLIKSDGPKPLDNSKGHRGLGVIGETKSGQGHNLCQDAITMAHEIEHLDRVTDLLNTMKRGVELKTILDTLKVSGLGAKFSEAVEEVEDATKKNDATRDDKLRRTLIDFLLQYVTTMDSPEGGVLPMVPAFANGSTALIRTPRGLPNEESTSTCESVTAKHQPTMSLSHKITSPPRVLQGDEDSGYIYEDVLDYNTENTEDVEENPNPVTYSLVYMVTNKDRCSSFKTSNPSLNAIKRLCSLKSAINRTSCSSEVPLCESTSVGRTRSYAQYTTQCTPSKAICDNCTSHSVVYTTPFEWKNITLILDLKLPFKRTTEDSSSNCCEEFSLSQNSTVILCASHSGPTTPDPGKGHNLEDFMIRKANDTQRHNKSQVLNQKCSSCASGLHRQKGERHKAHKPIVVGPLRVALPLAKRFKHERKEQKLSNHDKPMVIEEGNDVARLKLFIGKHKNFMDKF